MIDLDVIGLIYTPGVYEGDTVVTAPVPVPGWHVNTTVPVAGWEAYRVTPETPRRVFGGHETFYYSFASKEEYLEELADAGLGDA